ncbi:sugar/nucleoside kinase (ribokinase family) [Nocardiopsis sp. Huas11]|uniref:carbohydrate kinase family protein n=1 Tax=Nocardiopsis sp. Huas11 TaxID=2183912 RepID=UPI000EB41B06|nr:carbohydrate kinase family protein [Nocardiopsis sp. Huas11]RKS08148.1 sugar/nucleoside kinase (ribokinase family) [Nocardiopsis sp. Huas11]
MTPFEVLGGTYQDDVYWVGSELDFDVSLTAAAHERVPGGPGACLALALRRLGAEVRLSTALGDGDDTRRARDLLEAEGVHVRAHHHRGPLDHAITLVTPSLESVTVTHRSLPPPEPPPSAAPPPEPSAGPPSASPVPLVVCSPTPLTGLAARVRGRRLVLVPHHAQCRELTAMRPAERAALLGAVDLLVANEGEHAVLAAVPELGSVPAVVVTRGPRGSVLRLGDARLEQGPATEPEAPPLNPNGAGEAFTAALLATRALGAPWPEAMRAAARYAGRHVTERSSLSFPRCRPHDLVRPAGRTAGHSRTPAARLREWDAAPALEEEAPAGTGRAPEAGRPNGTEHAGPSTAGGRVPVALIEETDG